LKKQLPDEIFEQQKNRSKIETLLHCTQAKFTAGENLKGLFRFAFL
jgi:hypothetical protein